MHVLAERQHGRCDIIDGNGWRSIGSCILGLVRNYRRGEPHQLSLAGLDSIFRIDRFENDNLFEVLVRLLGQPSGRYLLYGVHDWLERDQLNIRSLCVICAFEWQMPPMGGCCHHMHHSLDHLCPGHNVDSSTRCSVVDSAVHRMVCRSWYRSTAFHGRWNPITYWCKWSSCSPFIHCSGLLICCIVGELRCRLQRQNANQHASEQDICCHIHRNCSTGNYCPGFGRSNIQRNFCRPHLEAGIS